MRFPAIFNKISSQFPLIIILLIAFVLRINNLYYNSPFIDEAMHIKLGKKVLSRTWEESAPFSWVGGLPLFYPRITAFVYNYGGLIASRFLNVILGTFSVLLYYRFNKYLHLSYKEDTNEFISGISALLLAISAVPIFLSRLAVYDMLSFTLFLVSLLLLQKGLVIIKPGEWQRENHFFFAFIFLFISYLAKYTTVIYFPLLILWAIYQSKRKGRLIYISCLKYFVLPLIFFFVFYVIWNLDSLRTFYSNQFGNSVDNSSEIINMFFDYTVILLPFSFLGMSILYIRNHPAAFFLFLGSLVVPVFHLLTNNVTSLIQHSFLSLIFLIPPVTFLLSLIREKDTFIKITAALLLLIPVFFQSQTQVISLETSWSNSNNVMDFLKSNVRENDKILSSEDDITNLALPRIPENNIYGYWNFEYQGKKENEAFQQAIQDGFFNFILINEKLTANASQTIRESITGRYEIIYDTPPFKIYRLLI